MLLKDDDCLVDIPALRNMEAWGVEQWQRAENLRKVLIACYFIIAVLLGVLYRRG